MRQLYSDEAVTSSLIPLEGRSIVDARYDELRYEGGEFAASTRDSAEFAEPWDDAVERPAAEISDRFAEQLRDERDPSGVDTISGATESSRRFVQLAREAIDARVDVEFVEVRESLRGGQE